MSKHKQEDPWAGFVDVLSNILMVVIFLVVILGISIFAISQQITKAAVERAVKAEREQAKPEAPPPSAASAAPSAQASAGTPSNSTQPGAPAPDTKTDGERGAAGVYQSTNQRRARQSDDIAGDTNLTVRSLAVNDPKTIEVASEEAASPNGPVEVKSSQAFLTLKFKRGSFKIDEAASGEIQAFLRGKGDVANTKLEIRAFAQSTVGSVSEARRIAYYRAMQTRSELIRGGLVAGKIELKLRESASPEELDVVRIFAKS